MSEPNQTGPVVVNVRSSLWRRFTQKLSGKWVLICLVLVTVAAGLLAYKLNYAVEQTGQKQAAVTSEITVSDTGFMPQTIRVKQGSTVTWINLGTQPHQIAADPFPKNDSIPGFDSTILLQPKDTYSFIFEESGTYHYHDERNPLKLLGTVIVE